MSLEDAARLALGTALVPGCLENAHPGILQEIEGILDKPITVVHQSMMRSLYTHKEH